MPFRFRFALVFGGLAALAAEVETARWPQFRGPEGSGAASQSARPPVEFGPSKSLLWKTPLPVGHGSPCIWDDRIFVTAFDKAAGKLELIALDRTNGKMLWRAAAPSKEIEKVHEISSPATSTPVTDGKRIYVYYGSFGLIAYEWDGKEAWEFPMQAAKSPYGSGASPALAGDLILITRDYRPTPELFAISRVDGKLAWKVSLPVSPRPGSGAAHSTPAIWRDQVLLHRPSEIAGYSLKDGARLWWVNLTTSGTSTLLVAQDVVYVSAFSIVGEPEGIPNYDPYSVLLEKYDRNKDGKLSPDELPENGVYLVKRVGVPDNVPGAHFSLKTFFFFIDTNKDGFVDQQEWSVVPTLAKRLNTTDYGMMAIRPGGEGDMTASAILWKEQRSVPEVPAPLLYHGRVYMIANGGILSSMDAKSGQMVFRARVGAAGAYYASPVAANGKIFVASSEGVVTVAGEGDTLKVLSKNDLEEPIFGTPALVSSAVYIRSLNHLWAFESR